MSSFRQGSRPLALPTGQPRPAPIRTTCPHPRRPDSASAAEGPAPGRARWAPAPSCRLPEGVCGHRRSPATLGLPPAQTRGVSTATERAHGLAGRAGDGAPGGPREQKPPRGPCGASTSGGWVAPPPPPASFPERCQQFLWGQQQQPPGPLGTATWRGVQPPRAAQASQALRCWAGGLGELQGGAGGTLGSGEDEEASEAEEGGAAPWGVPAGGPGSPHRGGEDAALPQDPKGPLKGQPPEWALTGRGRSRAPGEPGAGSADRAQPTHGRVVTRDRTDTPR